MADKSKDASRGGSDGDAERIVIRDRRKIDPTGGTRRPPEPEEGDVEPNGKAGAHRAAEPGNRGVSCGIIDAFDGPRYLERFGQGRDRPHGGRSGFDVPDHRDGGDVAHLVPLRA